MGMSALQGSTGKAFEVLWDDTLPSPRAATATQLSHSQHPSPWHPSPMPPPAGPDHPPRNPPLAPLLLTTPQALPRSPPCLCSTLSHQVSLAGAPQGDTGSDKPSPVSGQVPSVVAVPSQAHWVPGILTPFLGTLRLLIPPHRAPISQCLHYLAASCREGEMGPQPPRKGPSVRSIPRAAGMGISERGLPWHPGKLPCCPLSFSFLLGGCLFPAGHISVGSNCSSCP